MAGARLVHGLLSVFLQSRSKPTGGVSLHSSRHGAHCLCPPSCPQLLNGELKQLYTAITRARANLWIFDENPEKRAPAFRYFIRRDFVQVVKTDENKGTISVKSSARGVESVLLSPVLMVGCVVFEISF